MIRLARYGARVAAVGAAMFVGLLLVAPQALFSSGDPVDAQLGGGCRSSVSAAGSNRRWERGWGGRQTRASRTWGVCSGSTRSPA